MEPSLRSDQRYDAWQCFRWCAGLFFVEFGLWTQWGLSAAIAGLGLALWFLMLLAAIEAAAP